MILFALPPLCSSRSSCTAWIILSFSHSLDCRIILSCLYRFKVEIHRLASSFTGLDDTIIGCAVELVSDEVGVIPEGG